MHITPISEHTGARISGLDLGKPLSDEERNDLMSAWHQYHLFVFPDQINLTEQQQIDFCRYFGPIMLNTAGTEIGVVSNKQSGFTHPGKLSWHMDLAFTPTPIEALCLYAMVLPKQNTSTWFVNNIEACQTLSSELAAKIEERRVRNIFDMSINQHVVRYKEEQLSYDWPHVSVPLIQLHPNKNRRAFMCCEMFSDPIEGLSKADSDCLMEEVFAHLYSAEHIVEISWEQNQLIIWDNLALQHSRRESLIERGERTLRRVTISEENGYEYFSELVETNMPQFRGDF